MTTWRVAATVEVSSCVFLDGDPYERLTKMAQHARADRSQFLEHLLLRAEAIYNFQPPVLPAPRPWWKLWIKEEREPAVAVDCGGTTRCADPLAGVCRGPPARLLLPQGLRLFCITRCVLPDNFMGVLL